ncbi:TAXI family TRAP transporter solute-binding subunit [Salibacterium salarium]|uniref:TAXI family TRAP transporter solute-binding subunit n=1 Tax=Salibacterium salarium TaxID=284579 RepID=A0A428N5G1_9BACI|nr:TAXI family TRAP transporter solute-binding subunit [Salibacterium salarium]RSL33519.1 TAXI family TRAP transporter solute-binding subunit [Salibacterium salarium]
MEFTTFKKTGILILSSALFGLTGCGNDGSTSGEDSGSNQKAEETETTDVEEKDYPSTVTIGTASQGGAYYLIGGGLGNLLEENLDVSSNVEATGGPIHNLQLLNSGDSQLGMVTTGPLAEAYSGEGDWLEEQFDGIRVAFPMYYTPFHWWSREETDATSLQDLQDQRVGVGPSGGTSGTYAPMIHEILGLNTDDVQAGIGDLASQMLDRQLDYIGFAGGLPTPSVTEIEAQADINIFGIEGEDRDKVMEEMDYFDTYTISSDTYESLEEDIESIAMYNFGVVNEEASEEFVYDLVKAYHENIDQMISTHSALGEAEDLEAILKNQQYPMHPGAIRYYEENDIDLPEEVYPE